MRSSVRSAGALLAGLFVAASTPASTPAFAQETVMVRATRASDTAETRSGKAFSLTPYAGYIAFGNFLDGPLGTSVSSAGGPLYGAQLGMKLAPGLTLVGNVAYSSGDLRVGIPFLGGFSIGKSRALLSDAGIQLDLPTPGAGGLRLAPFVQAGAGAIHYDIDLGTSLLQTQSTSFAGNLGLGADLPIGRTAALRFMAKDYIGKFDFEEAVGLDLVKGKTTHNWALTAGLRLEF